MTSSNTLLLIIGNIFDLGNADWGSYMDFEIFYSIRSENNLFLNGMASAFIGTASSVIFSGSTDYSLSVYMGKNNKYIYGISENRGLFL